MMCNVKTCDTRGKRGKQLPQQCERHPVLSKTVEKDDHDEERRIHAWVKVSLTFAAARELSFRGADSDTK